MVEEHGIDCGSWIDLEEVGDLGDDRGRDALFADSSRRIPRGECVRACNPDRGRDGGRLMVKAPAQV
jgi:hypothetical protein